MGAKHGRLYDFPRARNPRNSTGSYKDSYLTLALTQHCIYCILFVKSESEPAWNQKGPIQRHEFWVVAHGRNKDTCESSCSINSHAHPGQGPSVSLPLMRWLCSLSVLLTCVPITFRSLPLTEPQMNPLPFSFLHWPWVSKKWGQICDLVLPSFPFSVRFQLLSFSSFNNRSASWGWEMQWIYIFILVPSPIREAQYCLWHSSHVKITTNFHNPKSKICNAVHGFLERHWKNKTEIVDNMYPELRISQPSVLSFFFGRQQ